MKEYGVCYRSPSSTYPCLTFVTTAQVLVCKNPSVDVLGPPVTPLSRSLTKWTKMYCHTYALSCSGLLLLPLNLVLSGSRAIEDPFAAFFSWWTSPAFDPYQRHAMVTWCAFEGPHSLSLCECNRPSFTLICELYRPPFPLVHVFKRPLSTLLLPLPRPPWTLVWTFDGYTYAYRRAFKWSTLTIYQTVFGKFDRWPWLFNRRFGRLCSRFDSSPSTSSTVNVDKPC